MGRLRFFSAGAVIALATGLIAASPASAVKINLNDTGGVTGSQAERGFRAAANFWETVLTNDATININVNFEDLGPDVLGGTGTQLGLVAVQDSYALLAATGNSALDAKAVANLSPLSTGQLGIGAINMLTPGYVDNVNQLGINNNTTVFDNDGSFNNSVIVLSYANLKALGVDPGEPFDAEISFSSTFAFDFDPTNGVDIDKYDFIGVAIHEIGHALGFISGVDDYDFLGCPNGPACADFADYPVNDDYWGYQLDLFRYSGKNNLNWVPGQDAYFSIDGGKTDVLGESNFSTGTFHGDEWQASHWKSPGDCSVFLGIMNPYICNGTVDEVKALDLAAMDAIGWNINFDVLANPDYVYTTAQAFAAIPEPAQWAQMLAGFGLIGGFIRSRRKLFAKAFAA